MHAQWIEHLSAAEIAFGEKNYSQAIEDYTLAINLMEESNENSLSAYNERGMAYFKNGNIIEALQDFSKVIDTYDENPISSILPQAVNALWNRLGVHSRLNQREQAIQDLNKITKIDPNFPIVEYAGNTLIIKNLYLSDYPDLKETFSSVMVELGVCESKDKIFFSQSGIVIIYMTKDFSVSVPNNENCCKSCQEKKLQRYNLYSYVNSRKLMECQRWCDDTAYSIGIGCAFCATPMGKAACAAAVYALKNGCHWCCSEGSFYKKCVKPLEVFNPKDPAWDNEYTKPPERDLNSKDIILNDPDVVYDWNDI